jgi:hypothetical protein
MKLLLTSYHQVLIQVEEDLAVLMFLVTLKWSLFRLRTILIFFQNHLLRKISGSKVWFIAWYVTRTLSMLCFYHAHIMRCAWLVLILLTHVLYVTEEYKRKSVLLWCKHCRLGQINFFKHIGLLIYSGFQISPSRIIVKL